jgi:hypothetical protein
MEWTVAIGVDTHKDVHVAVAVDSHFSCPVGRRTRVRMRVRTCLHDLPLVAVRYSVDSWSLQAV